MGRVVLNGEILGAVGVSAAPALLRMQLTNLDNYFVKKITRVRFNFENLTSDLEIDLYAAPTLEATARREHYTFKDVDIYTIMRTEYFAFSIEDDARLTTWRLSSVIFYGDVRGRNK